MCIAVYCPSGHLPTFDECRKMATANSDGFGLAWMSANLKEPRPRIYRTPKYEPWMYKGLSWEKDRSPMILHFRTASSGTCTINSNHPHRVNRDLAFVHNGNLFEFGSWFPGNSGTETDTQRFNRLVLQRLPADFLHRQDIMAALERYAADQMSKFIFMDSTGFVRIVNERSGEWRGGCWYSNRGIKDYAGYGYSGAYPYRPGEVRHKGGMVTVQMFTEERRKSWQHCAVCQGWHRMEHLIDGTCESCRTYLELMAYAV